MSGSPAPAVRCRLAGAADYDGITDLWLRARAAAVPAIPPVARSDAEVRDTFAGGVLVGHEVWVAEDEHPVELLGVLVLADGWVEQLYVHPERTGEGIGSVLLAHAQERRPGGLDLWTFETNTGARRFYERHGFTAVDSTDGSDNEERAPDVRYRWPGTVSSG